MYFRVRTQTLAMAPIALLALPLSGQQKGQWVPGQVGLNAGVVPDPGFTYVSMTINYSATQLNNSNSNAVPGLTGKYGFWADENFFFEPSQKFLGAHYVPCSGNVRQRFPDCLRSPRFCRSSQSMQAARAWLIRLSRH
jgi:hypothetical protein